MSDEVQDFGFSIACAKSETWNHCVAIIPESGVGLAETLEAFP